MKFRAAGVQASVSFHPNSAGVTARPALAASLMQCTHADVTRVEDVVAVADAGVMRTPALGIDGKLMLQRRVPGVQELATLIAKVRDSVR